MKKLMLIITVILASGIVSSCGGGKSAEAVAQLPVEEITQDDARQLIKYVDNFTRKLQQGVENKDSREVQNLMTQLAKGETVSIISKMAQLSDEQLGPEGIKVRDDFQKTISKVMIFGLNAANSADIE